MNMFTKMSMQDIIEGEWFYRHKNHSHIFDGDVTIGEYHAALKHELKMRQEKEKTKPINQRIYEYFDHLRTRKYDSFRTDDFRILVSPGTVSVHAITDTLTIEPLILHLVIDGQNRVHCLFADISNNDKQYAYLQLVKMV